MWRSTVPWLLGCLALTACGTSYEVDVALEVTPERADLGQTFPSQPLQTAVFTVVNPGPLVIDVETIELEGDGALLIEGDVQPRRLAPGEVLAVTVRQARFDEAIGARAATLVVTGRPIEIEPRGCEPGTLATNDSVELRAPITWLVVDRCDNDGDNYLSEECGGDDCEDQNAAVNPGAPELCNGIDDNCDGLDASEVDIDQDGFSACQGDCAPNDPTVGPANAEVCNGIDDNCDGVIPPNELDNDNDGSRACFDCDDNNPTTAPGRPELCNGIDDNCDGVVPSVEFDTDGDGLSRCEGDCNDTRNDVFPGAAEVCDNVDNDCDGLVDENTNDDNDNDGFTLCGGDCNDAEPGIFPGAPERCNGLDDDCDTLIPTNERDADDDGQRVCAGDCGDQNPAVGLGFPELCDGLDNNCDTQADEGFDQDDDGFASCGGDCNDADPLVNPGAPERCNGLDDNCDGRVPPNEIDQDGDGVSTCRCPLVPVGSPECDCDDANPMRSPLLPELCNGLDDNCDQVITGESDVDGDAFLACNECDDNNAARFPGNPEICDGIDNDCDEVVPANETVDADNDGFVVCLDCDDTRDDVNPGAPEILCDGADNNCDGVLPARESEDADGDDFTFCDDCNDGNARVFPGAAELCNNLDDNCNDLVDEGVDDDLDGDGVSACDGDCNDADRNIFPGASERCNLIDDNCNNNVDEAFRRGGRYVFDEHCGTCNNDCGEADFANAVGFCSTVPATPACAFECLDGFFDVNGARADGCECEFISEDDPPFDGIDQNCDGLDGFPEDAIHVSASTGRNNGAGTPADPVRTIAQGLQLASSSGLFAVNVARGVYPERVDLLPGISVFGGFTTSFATRDPLTNPSEISRVGLAVVATGITVPTIFDGFDVRSQADELTLQPAIAIWVENVDADMVFSNNRVFTGPGFAGLEGFDGAFGADGVDGGMGQDGGITTCANLPVGGQGGQRTCGNVSVAGGDGGSAECPMAFELQPDGDMGLPSSLGGSGGLGTCDVTTNLNNENPARCTCFIDTCWNDGGRGTRGLAGTEGVGGSGGSQASGIIRALTNGGWIPADGVDGEAGRHGGGGGGGGAGSGVAAGTCGQNAVGGTGGGGGSGGCGGTFGEGGGGGAASIGILVRGSGVPSLFDNQITASNGGRGGGGGDGGQGGIAGEGGLAGDANRQEAFCSEDGGDGANGGRGGAAGGGGGGAGGPSFAIFVANPPAGSSNWADANVLMHGSGGLGGAAGQGGGTAASRGTAGVRGASGTTNY